MGAPTDYFVDPSIDADSGAGTLGDPYGDLQHALDSITRDGTNGDKINIKAGTDEVLTGSIDLSTYGTPGPGAELFFRGYTSSADDGGIGGISGGGSVSIISSGTLDAIVFIDLHLHNCGAQSVVVLDQVCAIINCEIDNTSANGIDLDISSKVVGCHIHNVGGKGIVFQAGFVMNNYLANDGGNSMTTAIEASSNDAAVMGNVVSVSGTTNGIVALSVASVNVSRNSVLTSGSGNGIDFTDGSGSGNYCVNNLVEGWTTGIRMNSSNDRKYGVFVGNGGFDNGTDFDVGGMISIDNESLSATPFAKDGSDTYANRATYFAPVDTGNVLSPFGGMGGAKGAVQPSSGGGGASATVVARRSFQHFHL